MLIYIVRSVDPTKRRTIRLQQAKMSTAGRILKKTPGEKLRDFMVEYVNVDDSKSYQYDYNAF